MKLPPISMIQPIRPSDGFTLLELLVVLTIMAMGTAGVSFAFRDSQSTLLEREAERISVILETARVQSRSSGVALAWLPLPQGFVILPAQVLQLKTDISLDAASVSPWLAPGMNAQIVSTNQQTPARSVLLGAEPMISPAAVELSLGERKLRIATDGLRPFSVQAQAIAATVP